MLDLETRKVIVVESEIFYYETMQEFADWMTKDGIDVYLEELYDKHPGVSHYDRSDIKQLILMKKRQVNEYREDIIKLNNYNFGGTEHTVDSSYYRQELDMLRETISKLEYELAMLGVYIQDY